MGAHEDMLVTKVCELYDKISKLESLSPSPEVNTLFTQLVSICTPPSSIDVSKLSPKVQEIRAKLIRLCGEAEGLLEAHFSSILASFESPMDHLHIFPYNSNYLKLSRLEFNILSQYTSKTPKSLAFVGSGPLPLTSITLALNHLKFTNFHNYDIDTGANSMALGLVSSHPDLSKRMFFHNANIMDVSHRLRDYDVVFLAALVGMSTREKAKVVKHLAKHMAPGALLMLRSAHGSRAFLYPVVEPEEVHGFDVLSVYHPTDDVINSVMVARKHWTEPGPGLMPVDTSGLMAIDQGLSPIILLNKCSEVQGFNPLGSMMEEIAVEEQAS
ncbi:hypothetical protein AMTRI_Chr02g223380 [Amborella trichopoda]|uniref:Nicotianamine synthase n=1 Tax=Amborella trichopoda TaxID=13333 RepID=W1P3B5_AMBTC|nr:nicotianamine synthase [Amborella trichopoda]ERN02134.1 hypothetical protein AMTR_s00045p00177240 [Amborella trichopoda]|eukprot:XP_006840459.1 nicotianamine synthase [Amborella trichopoda]